MNFYISIFKKNISIKKWIFLFFLLPLIYILIIFIFNFIIDPYGLTNYNLLNIKYKFTRNDRIDKIEGVKKFNSLDSILLGSSRVYSINPNILIKYIPNSKINYNFGIGGSKIEDHLGVLLYLRRIDKLPKNIILGIDFNGFNPNYPLNKYFLRNKDLNFLNEYKVKENYIEKFLTLDATRASFKTLKYHLKKKNPKLKFDKNGLFFLNDIKYNNINDLKLDKEKVFSHSYKNGHYPKLDKKRLEYVKRFIKICEEENINLIMYSSPTYIDNLKDIKKNSELTKRLEEFNKFFGKFDNFVNFLYENDFNKNNKYFVDRVHTTTSAGDKLIDNLFNSL